MTKYVAKLNDQIIGTRNSVRIYTHAVAIQHDQEWHRERAHSTAYAQQHNSKKNFDYCIKQAAWGVEGLMAEYSWLSTEKAEKDVAEAKRVVAIGYDAWVEERRLVNIKNHEAQVAKGNFAPAIVGWNGRRDLAEKLAAQYRGKPSIARVWVVAVEEVAKLPKIKGERKHAAYGPHSD